MHQKDNMWLSVGCQWLWQNCYIWERERITNTKLQPADILEKPHKLTHLTSFPVGCLAAGPGPDINLAHTLTNMNLFLIQFLNCWDIMC